MKITTFEDLSLRILMTLSFRAPQTSQELSESVGLPYNHVSKAVLRLRELGLLDVKRGRAGGSALSETGRAATVGQVLRALDERTDVADCVNNAGASGAPRVCPLIHGCGLRGALNRAREAFYTTLDVVVISELPSVGGEGPVGLGLPVLRSVEEE